MQKIENIYGDFNWYTRKTLREVLLSVREIPKRR